MLEDKSNPNQKEESSEEEFLEEESNLEEEEESVNTSAETDEESEESSEDILAQINKGASKKFKDVSQVVKALKQVDKDFIKKGTKKEDETELKPQGIEERMLKLENPDSEHVLDEIRKDAELSGKSVTQLWDTVPYYQKKAQSIAEEVKRKEKAEDRIGEPSSQRPAGKGVTLSPESKRLANDLGVTPEEIAKTVQKRRERESK